MNNSSSEFIYSFTDDYFEAAIHDKKNKLYDMTDGRFLDIYTHRFPYVVKEIESHKPILISGCSMTVGGGIEKEEIWADILCKKMNLEYNNIALSGSSVGRQVRGIFTYIKEFGPPEYIFALFPGFNRIELPNNQNFFKFNNKKDNINDYITTANVQTDASHKYFKMPYEPEFIFPQDMCQYYSNLQIMYLEEYCKALGIKLYWATWHQKQYEILDHVRRYSSNLYQMSITNPINAHTTMWVPDAVENKINYTDPETLEPKLCHIAEKNERPDNFHFAPDREDGVEFAHWGYHRHLHMAEIFFNQVQND